MEQISKASQAAWWQLSVEVPQQWADDASASLIAAGAEGVQIVDEGMEPLPAFAKHAINPRVVASSRDNALLVAHYGHTQDASTLPQEAVEALAELGLQISADSVQLIQRADRDWAERWKQYFKPIKIGRRLWIVPTWDKTFLPPINSVVLHLDPGMAFGTGQHATTALCLRAIEQYASRLEAADAAQRKVLDLGTGTGILAMGAAKMGLGKITALDNDPEAVDAARENFKLNGVQGLVDGTPIDKVADTFGLVVANILALPLIGMAPVLAKRVATRGILVLSGILAEQADEVIRAYEKTSDDLRLQLRWTHGEWVALIFANL